MARLIEDLESMHESKVLRWASPVPFFGRITEAVVATVGINPSNREFVGTDGLELEDQHRRLPTLHSLSRASWAGADGGDIRTLTQACLAYFEGNPYRLWFDVLERMLNPGGFSYYGESRAAHIDLVSYATRAKWGALSPALRNRLIIHGRRTLAEVIRESPIQILVLNGRSVVNAFMASAAINLAEAPVTAWTLPRASGRGVAGIRYSGTLTSLAGIEFERQVRVIGFNHNLQSSFGVTRAVVRRIAQEVGEAVDQAHVCAAS